MKNKLLIIILFSIAILLICSGVVIGFIDGTNNMLGSGLGKRRKIYDEKYIVEFNMPKIWREAYDDESDLNDDSEIKYFVKNAKIPLSLSEEFARMWMREYKIDSTYLNKSEYIDSFQYKIENTEELLTDGVENKTINGMDVYYYIENNTPISGIMRMEATVFFVDTHFINISIDVKHSSGDTKENLIKYITDIVGSIEFRENNGELVKEEEKETTTICYNDEEIYGLNKRNLDYYYNIDTSKFDKSKFDGNINFFGATINGKITVAKLKEQGIIVGEAVPKKDNYGYHNVSPKFSINTSSDIQNSHFQMNRNDNMLMVSNFTGSDNLQSNDALVHLNNGWNLTARNIYPSQLGVNDYGKINIDLILEKLGNPTYVGGRKDSCISNLYSYTTYYYVYDEVAFLYAFANWEDLNLVSVFYYPIDVLNGSVRDMTDIIGLLKREHNEYINNK